MRHSERPNASNPEPLPRGVKLLHDPLRNKGTAFSEPERDALGLRGLLPPRVHPMEVQEQRVLENVRRKPNDLERYIYLTGLQDRNETLFYRVIVDHLEEFMPIIYTPTVGKACQEYGHLFRRPRGLFVSSRDRGRIAEVLENWPSRDVRIIVVTDGGRILGLGDLGAEGMGIPVGKLSLYTACAGVAPSWCLPITLDVGTDNTAAREDPLYIGIDQPRLRGEAYDSLIAEFFEAAARVFPRAVIQLEDFANENAFRLLEQYRGQACTFDDDIQGTGSVAVAGLYSALRITDQRISEQSYLFAGAGEAGVGIAGTIVAAMVDDGLSEEEARGRCWLMDSKGLVVKSRTGLAEHKRAYAHEHDPIADLATAIDALRPTGLIGVSGTPGIFSRPVLERMGHHNARPVIFALSNPTSKAECTAEQAYRWTGGRAIFASGSPFDPVEQDGRTFVPGQGNNAYIFPGVGLGVIVAEAREVTDEMFFTAAKVLAAEVSWSELEQGSIYPRLARIRDVSAKIAAAVAEIAHERGLARAARPDDFLEAVRESMWEPDYRKYA